MFKEAESMPDGDEKLIKQEKARGIIRYAWSQTGNLKDKIDLHVIGLYGDTMMIALGGLSIAAVALGPSTMGASVGVAAGGVALGIGAKFGADYVYRKIETSKQEKREVENPLLSERGILTTLYFALKDDMRRPEGEREFTKIMFEEHLKIEPKIFMAMAEPIAETFRDEFRSAA